MAGRAPAQRCYAAAPSASMAAHSAWPRIPMATHPACPATRLPAPLGMPPLNLGQLAVGERVQHELLVVDRVEKTHGNGDPFVILKLGNASGHIDVAPIWFNQREWADGANRGRVVQAIGQVGLYPKTGKRQIQLTGPLRVLPTEQVDLH